MRIQQTTNNAWFGRKPAFGLHVGAALTFAGLMVLVGMVPTDSGRTEIIYQSFGVLAVLRVTEYLFNPYVGILPLFQLPAWGVIALFSVMSVLYALAFTLPICFFSRTHRHWLLAVQFFAFALHASFARLVVAPYWIHQ